MAVRLQFVPGQEPPDLIDLPWDLPLEKWDHPRLVRMAAGVSPTLSWADLQALGIAATGSYTVSVTVSDGRGGVTTSPGTPLIEGGRCVQPTMTIAMPTVIARLIVRLRGAP